MSFLSGYAKWLHLRWPAGTVEKMPEVMEGGKTRLPGVRVVGDLTGIPLLKFSADTGARAVQEIASEPGFEPLEPADEDRVDLAIIGAGVSGVAAALEARRLGLRFEVFEAAQPFNTLVNFPKGKPIFTYPTEMTPAGELQVSADVKEALIEELERQKGALEITNAHVDRLERKGKNLLVHFGKEGQVLRAQRVIVAIGRSGNYRKLGVQGQDLDKVFHRLYDPKEHAQKNALVVGGGDSALETAIALASCGAHVTLSYRKPDFSRPKPENIEKIEALERDPAAEVMIENPVSDRTNTSAGPFLKQDGSHGSIRRLMGSKLKEITAADVLIEDSEGAPHRIENDVVFAMIGREAPLDFFRRSKIPIRGEWSVKTWASFAAFLLFCTFVYNWKSSGVVNSFFRERGLFPFSVKASLQGLSASAQDPSHFLGTLALTLEEPGFYYAFAYSVCVVLFGIDRIRRRNTPYVTVQTLCLMMVQVLPLFLLPYLLLPFLGHNGAFDSGFLKTAADNLFPVVSYGQGREYWRAFGFVLAWPLFIWNFFTHRPMMWWLVIGGIQTFVFIPLLVRFFGKGAYCGWICSCGALAETLGDRHRTKMPHGPKWNRLNFVGQVALAVVALLFGLRVVSWVTPQSGIGSLSQSLYDGLLSGWSVLGIQLNYYHLVDIFLAGILGVGCYFWFSGRVWCRFACPLAALMHIYARFSKFRIFPEKSKCISCNVCTSVCHQGIDVMNFANKGVPMEDPECVRCSACVQSCPTGVLSFGRYGGDGLVKLDRLKASPVQIREASEG